VQHCIDAMPANMQLLQLEPESALHFNKTPMTSSPSRVLKVTNMSSGNVAFKVKTTAPKAYLVRPSSGTLKPNGFQEVQIILQPQGADANTFTHRFLVQAVPVQSSETVSREQWFEYPKDAIQEQRLSVVLEEQQSEMETISKPETVNNEKLVSADEQPGDLKVKYDELVQYTLMLEKDKKKLEVDLAESRSAKGNGVSGSGINHLQMVAVAVFGFLLAYLPKLIFEKGA